MAWFKVTGSAEWLVQADTEEEAMNKIDGKEPDTIIITDCSEEVT